MCQARSLFVARVSIALFCTKASKSFCSNPCFLIYTFCDLFTYTSMKALLLYITIFLPHFAPKLALCAIFDGHMSVKILLLICFVKIFAITKLAGKLELSSLNMRRTLDWVEEGKKAPLHRIMDVLKAKMEERKNGNFTSISAITDPPLLREAGTKQVHQILLAPAPVHTYATSTRAV